MSHISSIFKGRTHGIPFACLVFPPFIMSHICPKLIYLFVAGVLQSGHAWFRSERALPPRTERKVLSQILAWGEGFNKEQTILILEIMVDLSPLLFSGND